MIPVAIQFFLIPLNKMTESESSQIGVPGFRPIRTASQTVKKLIDTATAHLDITSSAIVYRNAAPIPGTARLF